MIKWDDSRADRTEVVLKSKKWLVRLQLRGLSSPQERRQLGRAISEMVSKAFDVFDDASWITHPDGYWANVERDQMRGINLGRGVNLQTERGRIGFEIRMARLKRGWKLADLAREARINSSHLSLIERGLSSAKAATLIKIQQALAKLDPTQSDPKKE